MREYQHKPEIEYSGSPRCQDCKWKLGTPLTDNCPCTGNRNPEQYDLYVTALEAARKQQERNVSNKHV